MTSAHVCSPDSFHATSLHFKHSYLLSLFRFILDSPHSFALDATLFTPAEYELFLKEYIQYLCGNINIYSRFLSKGKTTKQSKRIICVSLSVCVFLFKCVLIRVQQECYSEGILWDRQYIQLQQTGFIASWSGKFHCCLSFFSCRLKARSGQSEKDPQAD